MKFIRKCDHYYLTEILYTFLSISKNMLPWQGLEYTGCIPCRESKILSCKVCPEYDTKLHLMMRLQLLKNPSLPWLPVLLSPRVEVIVRVLSISQIDLFRNYSYLIGPYAKRNYTKNVYAMNTIPKPLGLE